MQRVWVRGGTEVRVTQAVVRNAIERGRGDNSAKRARHTESRVVGHDQQNVWRALRRYDSRIPAGLVFGQAVWLVR